MECSEAENAKLREVQLIWKVECVQFPTGVTGSHAYDDAPDVLSGLVTDCQIVTLLAWLAIRNALSTGITRLALLADSSVFLLKVVPDHRRGHDRCTVRQFS